VTDRLPRYESGVLPDELVALTRSTIRSAGITQEDAARRIGISRPQLANALQRRYGLSVEAAAQLLGFLEQPPRVRQLELC
jgi:transcriptional regulator with XRE-family HTH domain